MDRELRHGEHDGRFWSGEQSQDVQGMEEHMRDFCFYFISNEKGLIRHDVLRLVFRKHKLQGEEMIVDLPE